MFLLQTAGPFEKMTPGSIVFGTAGGFSSGCVCDLVPLGTGRSRVRRMLAAMVATPKQYWIKRNN